MDSTSVAAIGLSNITTSLPYIYQPGEGTFYVVLTCIILVGLIGNITFILTVLRVPSLHTSTYIYLTSLACADLFTLIGIICNVTFEIFIPLLGSKNIIALQVVSEMVLWFSFASSLCLVTLVSLERYLAICHPIKHRVLKGTRRTFKMIAATCLVALAISCTVLPNVLYSLDQLYSQITYIIYVGYFLSCLTYNCFMYVRILQTLKQRQRNRTLPLSTEFERNIQQVAIMVIVNGITFFIFSSTITAYFITFLFYLSIEKLSSQLYVDVEIFGYVRSMSILLNASVNPIIYFIANSRYRSALKTSIFRPCYKYRNR